MAVPCPAASEVQDRALSWGACGTPAHDFNNFALGSRIDQWSWDHKKFSLEYYNNWEDIRTSDLEDSVIFASITHSISDSSTLTTISIRTDLPFLPGMHRFPQDRTNPPNSHAKNVGYETLRPRILRHTDIRGPDVYLKPKWGPLFWLENALF